MVTNDFHMARTKAIFEWVFSLPLTLDALDAADGGAGKKDGGGGHGYELSFVGAPDDGMSPEVGARRRALSPPPPASTRGHTSRIT